MKLTDSNLEPSESVKEKIELLMNASIDVEKEIKEKINKFLYKVSSDYLGERDSVNVESELILSSILTSEEFNMIKKFLYMKDDAYISGFYNDGVIITHIRNCYEYSTEKYTNLNYIYLYNILCIVDFIKSKCESLLKNNELLGIMTHSDLEEKIIDIISKKIDRSTSMYCESYYLDVPSSFGEFKSNTEDCSNSWDFPEKHSDNNAVVGNKVVVQYIRLFYDYRKSKTNECYIKLGSSSTFHSDDEYTVSELHFSKVFDLFNDILNAVDENGKSIQIQKDFNDYKVDFNQDKIIDSLTGKERDEYVYPNE